MRRGGFTWAACVAALAIFIAPAAANASGQVFFGGWYDSAIGSVNSDGSDPQPNLVVNDETVPLGMAADGDYLYWESNSAGVRIGRSRLDGSEANFELVGINGGPPASNGVSISGGRIYWTEKRNATGFGPLYLSSANLDGSDPQVRFLSLGTNAEGTAFVSGAYVFFVIQKDVRGVERYSDRRGQQALCGRRSGRERLPHLLGRGKPRRRRRPGALHRQGECQRLEPEHALAPHPEEGLPRQGGSRRHRAGWSLPLHRLPGRRHRPGESRAARTAENAKHRRQS